MAAAPQISEQWNKAHSEDLSGQVNAPVLTLSGDFSLYFGSGKSELLVRHKLLIYPPVKIDDDFHGWLLSQASALREQQFNSLDYDNLAEELEAMAIRERRELRERLSTLFEHLLKLTYQPNELEHRGHGWRVTVARSRVEISRLLDQSPGLKGYLEQLSADAYDDARKIAGTEMGLRRKQWEQLFPAKSPWTISQALEVDSFPA